MLKSYAALWCGIGHTLQSLPITFTDPPPADAPYEPKTLLYPFLDDLERNCVELGLVSALARVRELRNRTQLQIPELPEAGVQEIVSDLIQIRRSVLHELMAHKFLYIPLTQVAYYENPLDKWDAAIAKFTEITTDIEEASKCFVLNRYTACVFHLMRIMELGVQKLGDHFDVAGAADKLWGGITNEIGQKVKALPRTTPAETASQAAFAEATLHLDHVRFAWRNPTMHPKQTYTEEEARDVLDKVRIYMNHLAQII